MKVGSRPRLILTFPAKLALGLFVLVTALAALNLHGSSIGTYHEIFDGPEAADPNLILGEPRGIRSDEWLRWTPLVASQAKLGYPEVNPSLRDGVDLAVIYDVPHGGWTAFFEPQHAMFHVGPGPEFAFAFKWFGLLATSFFAATVFARRLGGLRPPAAMLAGALWALSPFFHWWYQSQAFLAASYGMLVVVMFLAALDSPSRRRSVLIGFAIGYIGAAALMLQYPPYLLSAALPSLVLLASHMGRLRTTLGQRVLVERFLLVGLPAGLIVGVTGLVFVVTKADLIAAIGASEHPGGRSFSSGEGTWRSFGHLMSGNLAPSFLSDGRAANYFMNQSEAAGFLPLLPTLVVVGIFRQFRHRRSGRSLQPDVIALVVFAAIMAVWLFVPGVSAPFRVLLFDQIPINRFVFMLGLTQFALLVVLLREPPESTIAPDADPRLQPLARYLSGALIGVGTAAMILLGNRIVIGAAPGFVSGRVIVVSTILAVSAGLVWSLHGHPRTGLAALVGLSLASSATINPLYRGLDPVMNTVVVDRIETIAGNDPDAAWAVLGGLVFENLAVEAGARSISGSTPSTQVDWWTTFYARDAETERIVDRSAHFAFQLADRPGTWLELTQRNYVTVHLDPCDEFSDAVDLRYIVAPHPLVSSCLELIEIVEYEQLSFLFYERI